MEWPLALAGWVTLARKTALLLSTIAHLYILSLHLYVIKHVREVPTLCISKSFVLTGKL